MGSGPVGELSSRVGTHRRRRLARTLSRSRFRDYRSLLRAAISEGYHVVSLETFLDAGGPVSGRELILRHDVDQLPHAALAMAEIERALGVRSTWYLRWRTAEPAVVEALRQGGHGVGLHYETLTRRVIGGAMYPGSDLRKVIPACRAELRGEVTAFGELFGRIHSVCAHGDTRARRVRNLQLLEGEDLADYGVRFDANLSLRRHRLNTWLTDRSVAEGTWSGDLDPYALLRKGESPILCLTHPNNWVGGARLWTDRGLSAILPTPRPGQPIRVRRSRSDEPAQPTGRP